MSDIEKGRARYRAAKRRKASLETELDRRGGSENEKDGRNECVRGGERKPPKLYLL